MHAYKSQKDKGSLLCKQNNLSPLLDSACCTHPSGEPSGMAGNGPLLFMGKDPAFLFYYQDFLVGTSFMTNEEVGIYTRMLCHMAHKGGKLSLEHMQNICGAYGFSGNLKSKFLKDSAGLFYNERLSLEVEKRRLYSLSRAKNAHKAYAEHMENENENENTDRNKKRKNTLKPSLKETKEYFDELSFPLEADVFFDYFTSNDWKVGGRAPMKDWRAAARNWCRRSKRETEQPSKRDLQRQKVADKLKNLKGFDDERNVPKRDDFTNRSLPITIGK